MSAWTPVCRLEDLAPERGVAALLHPVADEQEGGRPAEQVALFRLVDDRVLAVQQHDPFSDAFVMSRGIVGTRTVDGEVRTTVASPMYKQVFDLVTGRCLEAVGKHPVRDLPADLRTYPVRLRDGVVEVGAAPSALVGEPAGREVA
ncbi:nitrite reductase small subunit NirD [Cellulomonas alba]|uniref:Nitrite reductase small subunit NirD n=1 Tax=Cellulomonas alba TaxID=3053467 RepID=A0ABT7SD31_9CELL|nr:nitrite reductase small subunit NirD [Cellulomonas alba]MDM7854088.1 nitrite reductase small subunit NirD [Cellulomonas alba]